MLRVLPLQPITVYLSLAAVPSLSPFSSLWSDWRAAWPSKSVATWIAWRRWRGRSSRQDLWSGGRACARSLSCEPRLWWGMGSHELSASASMARMLGWLKASTHGAGKAHYTKVQPHHWCVELKGKRGTCSRAKESAPCRSSSHATVATCPAGGEMWWSVVGSNSKAVILFVRPK
jgi:hypothetical protein